VLDRNAAIKITHNDTQVGELRSLIGKTFSKAATRNSAHALIDAQIEKETTKKARSLFYKTQPARVFNCCIGSLSNTHFDPLEHN
jgi:hypothetical protein